MIILGIETSCDETAVAILNSDNHILSNKLFSQIDIHKKFGGVVPEIAARSHVEFLPHLVEEALGTGGTYIPEALKVKIKCTPRFSSTPPETALTIISVEPIATAPKVI